jgi:hypothetical protein
MSASTPRCSGSVSGLTEIHQPLATLDADGTNAAGCSTRAGITGDGSASSGAGRAACAVITLGAGDPEYGALFGLVRCRRGGTRRDAVRQNRKRAEARPVAVVAPASDPG